jgi:geranylgeranyl pyrophosphate synthase
VESDKTTREALADFSDFLGIGYQIRDDLEDRQLVSTPEKFIELSIVDVLKSDKKLDNESAVKKAGELLNEYKQKALKSLSPLTNCNLKSLLFQLTNHILKLKV